MWFKNLVVYRLGDWARKAEAFEAKLAQQPLQKCGGFDMESRGWVCPQHEGQYLYQQNRHWLLALGFEQKLLPGSIIRDAAEEQVAAMESMLGHPIGRRQKRDIKDKVTAELLPRALSRRRTTYAWIDSSAGWLAIDAAGEPKAEQFMETLRKADDELPAIRLECEKSPSACMTRWIMAGEVEGPFTIDQDLELRSPDHTKATVRYARHPLEGKDIREHLGAGKEPVRLGLTWNDKISFVLTGELHVKRLSFLNLIEREPGEEPDNDDERFDIDFALMTGELAKMLADLVKALGGEKAARGRPAGRGVEKAAA
jgi:recombination associated protein RdgC